MRVEEECFSNIRDYTPLIHREIDQTTKNEIEIQLKFHLMIWKAVLRRRCVMQIFQSTSSINEGDKNVKNICPRSKSRLIQQCWKTRDAKREESIRKAQVELNSFFYFAFFFFIYFSHSYFFTYFFRIVTPALSPAACIFASGKFTPLPNFFSFLLSIFSLSYSLACSFIARTTS